MTGQHTRHSLSEAEAPSTLASIICRLFPHESSSPTLLRARSYLFHQGEPVESVHLVLRGALALERIDSEGRMVMFGIQKAGTLLSWQDHLDGQTHKNSAQTLTASQLVTIPCERFELALRQDDKLLVALMQQAAQQTSSYEEQIFRLSTLDVPDRLYWTLLSLADAPELAGDEIEVSTPLMKRDLAALVGTSPESISRSLNVLKRRKKAAWTDRNTYRVTVNHREE